jgi:hypothetical protein
MTEKTELQRIYEMLHGLREELVENTRKTDQLIKGFPEGDLEGHRRFHELLIAQLEERKNLRRELLFHLLKSSSWMALGGFFYVLWIFLKTELTK